MAQVNPPSNDSIDCVGLKHHQVWTNPIGYLYVTLGVIYLVIYTPCVVVLSSKVFSLKHYLYEFARDYLSRLTRAMSDID